MMRARRMEVERLRWSMMKIRDSNAASGSAHAITESEATIYGIGKGKHQRPLRDGIDLLYKVCR